MTTLNPNNDPTPIADGMEIYHKRYKFCLDIVPGVPNINTQIGPRVGDVGKVSVFINNNDAGNVFTFQVTRITLENI